MIGRLAHSFWRASRRGVWQAVSISLALAFVLPLYWLIVASLRQPGLPPPRTIEWFPPQAAWSNYARIFELVPLWSYLRNSALIIGLALPLTLITASWAGFAMVQLRTRMSQRLVGLTLVLLLVPLMSLWLPRYLLLTQLIELDNLWALALPAVMGSNPLFVLLFYWSFRSRPYELFESARLDGAGLLQSWALIAMPLARPTILVVSVLTFTHYWGDFITPLLYLKSERYYTLPLGLRTIQQLDQTNWPLLLAAAVVMTAPLILLFLVVQRYFWSENHHAGLVGR